MNKINLKNDLLTERSKVGVVVYFVITEIIAIALWVHNWPILAIILHSLAIQYATGIYKAEVFYNTKNGNKEFIRNWLIIFIVILGFSSIIFVYHGSKFSALFVSSMAFWQSIEVGKLMDFDKKQNGGISSEPGVFEKHYHIKTLLIPLGVVIYAFLAYQFFTVFNPF